MRRPETGRTLDTGHGEQGATQLLSAQEAAALLGVNARTVRRAIARGDLPATKRHGVFRIDSASLEAWQQRRATATASSPPSERRGQAARFSSTVPAPITPLIGRERELAIATSMLRREDVRLLTLTGAGGIGKTRLSLEVAGQLRDHFADGVHIVPLAEVPGAGAVVTGIAESLGIPESAVEDEQAALVAALRNARILLVLDNFEHVLEAAPIVSDLLGRCSQLKVMVTSRTLLRVRGEHALPIPPLELPNAAIDTSTEQAAASPAVRLFMGRAQAVAPSITLTAANASAVIAICQRLGGIPLAIELAASQVTVLPLDALLARIEAQLPLPFGGPRDVPDRQRTMTNAIAWSCALLSADEQRLFRRLGVFVGGFSLDAAGAVVGSMDIAHTTGVDATERDKSAAFAGRDTVAVLMTLVDSSLVQRDGQDPARFTMLEPIRAFALERLVAQGELDAACDALAGWCLALVGIDPMAAMVPGGELHLARLDAEHANIRRVLDWLYERHDAERLLSLVVELGSYWYERNHYHEGRVWTQRALAVGERAVPSVRARAMVQLGLFLSILGDRDRGGDLATEGVDLLRLAGENEALALALIWQGAIAMQHGAYDHAEQVLGEALGLAASILDAPIGAAISARAMSNLGATAHARGDLNGATRWHRMALHTCRDHGYLLGTTRSICDLADIARDRGEYATALAYYREGLAMLGERSDLRIVIAALEGAALATAHWNQGERAVRLLGAASGLSEVFSVPTLMPADRTAHELAMQVARARGGERGFDELFAAGRRLTLSEAIAEVLASSPPTGLDQTLPSPSATTVLLSSRETEVLHLLAGGLRDREIAERLFISVRTVEGHVARILAKLGVTSRLAAVRAASDLGLTSDAGDR